MSFVLASARDSSGKPTARNERGLVADSPVEQQGKCDGAKGRKRKMNCIFK
jgi:hypothetical protein